MVFKINKRKVRWKGVNTPSSTWKDGTTVKYKTVRESERGLSMIGLIIGIFAVIHIIYSIIVNQYSELLFVEAMISVVGISSFIYTYTSNWRRNRYKEYGRKFQANIIGAEQVRNVKGEDIYYFVISFYENGEKKFHHSEGYIGNPNDKLMDTDCAIYKWKGKYIESDLDILEMPPVHKLNIPITKHERMKKVGKEEI